MTNILIPARIPWMVSPSTPLLSLYSSEAVDESATVVQLVGYFALEDQQSDQNNPLIITIVPAIENLEISREKSIGPYKLLKIQFTEGLWVHMYPSYSEGEIIDWSKYNRSKITPSMQSFRDVSKYLEHFKDQWEKSGICPDPRIYEVIDSDWLRDTQADNAKFHHFLILGHDSYIEIIASKWDWESLGTINGF